MPNPNDARGTLTSVSCVSAAVCTAVGGGYFGYAERLRNAVWTATILPRATLTGISCVAETSCIAVGSQFGESPAVETLTATGWTLENLAAPKRGAEGSLLAGVQCFSATVCIAAGTAYASTYPDLGLPFVEQRS